MEIEYIGFKNISWLEKRRYNKIIYKWLSDQIEPLNFVEKKRTADRINMFHVRFFPTTMYKEIYGNTDWRSDNTGNLSDMIPHEIVGQFKIDLFILDTKDDMTMASNLAMISHGFGHVLLYSYDSSRRIELKYPDASGNKKGTVLAWYTAAVHNRTEKPEKTVQRLLDKEIDNQIYYLETWRFVNGFWRKVMYRMYDFRDDL